MIELEMSDKLSDAKEESSEGVMSSARSEMKERTRSVIEEADIEILLW